MNKYSKVSLLPVSCTRRSERRKKKIKTEIEYEYSISNPYKSLSSSKDLPEKLHKQLLKFQKLSLRNLQKLNFTHSQPTRERIPSSHQITIDGDSGDQALVKMRNAATKQENQYKQFTLFLQMNLYGYSGAEHSQRLEEFSEKKVEKELLDDDQQKYNEEFESYGKKMNENYSEEAGNIFHDNYESNRQRFLLYSDHNLQDNDFGHGFIKDDLDNYLI